ncbi:MAG TPA: hypothetical protein VF576_09270 [Rubricoccaceae bacterium]
MRLPSLLATFALLSVLSGCDVFDCQFDVSQERYVGRMLQADAPAPDTLTVAFVQTYAYDELRLFVRPDAGDVPDTLGAGQLSLIYDANGLTIGESDPAFETAARGDTLFVRAESGPEGGLYRRACSPPTTRLDVYVSAVFVPSGVRHVRFVTLDLYEDPGAFPVDVAPRHTAQPFLNV